MSVGELLLGNAQRLDDVRLRVISVYDLTRTAGTSARLRDVEEHLFDLR